MNALLASAQQKKAPKTAVFKVRAPASAVSVFPEDSVFWLEKDNKVRVKTKSEKEIKVFFVNGKIISQNNEDYVVKFDSSGSTAISVYEIDGKRRKLIYTMKYKVKEPEIYFCGVKVSSWASALKMREDHFKAHSVPLDTMLKVTGFNMIYHDGIKYKTFKAESNMLTSEMHKVIFEDFHFPADGRKQLFFTDIKAQMPDGSIKTLQPITLSVLRDSTNKDDVVFKFAVRRMMR
jgi:hypothetical protein